MALKEKIFAPEWKFFLSSYPMCKKLNGCNWSAICVEYKIAIGGVQLVECNWWSAIGGVQIQLRSAIGGVQLVECNWWSAIGGVQIQLRSAIGGVQLVECNWWSAIGGVQIQLRSAIGGVQKTCIKQGKKSNC